MTNALPRLTAIAAIVALATGVAHADVVFSENFDSTAFGHGKVSHNTSERWINTDLSSATQGTNGWDFHGDVYYARDAHSPNGSITLNETGGADNSASHILTGLIAGRTYALDFLFSGDNRPGQKYGLYAWIDTDLVFAEGHVEGPNGSSAGTMEHVLFTAKGSTAMLKFSEYTYAGSEASPTIDNVSVSLPEPASLALAGVALAGLGVARRRQQR